VLLFVENIMKQEQFPQTPENSEKVLGSILGDKRYKELNDAILRDVESHTEFKEITNSLVHYFTPFKDSEEELDRELRSLIDYYNESTAVLVDVKEQSVKKKTPNNEDVFKVFKNQIKGEDNT
jgi:hypothetical protein